MSDSEAIFGGLVLGGFLFVAGLFVGDHAGATGERKIAVKAGVGRWVTDEKVGDTHFVYGVKR